MRDLLGATRGKDLADSPISLWASEMFYTSPFYLWPAGLTITEREGDDSAMVDRVSQMYWSSGSEKSLAEQAGKTLRNAETHPQ